MPKTFVNAIKDLRRRLQRQSNFASQILKARIQTTDLTAWMKATGQRLVLFPVPIMPEVLTPKHAQMDTIMTVPALAKINVAASTPTGIHMTKMWKNVAKKL